jgi:hypothetical protein
MEVRADDKLVRKETFYNKHGLNFLIITRDNWQRDVLDWIELEG